MSIQNRVEVEHKNIVQEIPICVYNLDFVLNPSEVTQGPPDLDRKMHEMGLLF